MAAGCSLTQMQSQSSKSLTTPSFSKGGTNLLAPNSGVFLSYLMTIPYSTLLPPTAPPHPGHSMQVTSLVWALFSTTSMLFDGFPHAMEAF